MQITLYERNFSKPLPAGLCSFDVEWLSWAERGGPERGRVRATGPRQALQNLPQLLRCPVTITDEHGAAAWWGFVNEVELHLDGAVYLASLDGLANRVAVRWRDEADSSPAADAPGYTAQTGWEDHPASQARYGVKEMVFELGEARPEEALAARATQLLKRSLPVPRSTPGRQDGSAPAWAFLRLSGWWETLAWRFYEQPRGYRGNVEWQGLAYPWGGAAAVSKVAQTFLVGGGAAWAASDLWLRLYKVGSPADTVIVELCQYTASGPGTVYASASIAGGALEREPTRWVKLKFAAPYTVAHNTYYTLQVRRSGAVDAANYYGVRVEEGNKFGNSLLAWNGSSWAARTPAASMVLGLYGEEETTEQIKAICAPGAGGQFLTGLLIRDVANVKTRLFRLGKLRASAELAELLQVGAAGGEELSARVNVERQLVIEKRPQPAAPELVIWPDGEIRHKSGRALLGSETPVGRWARVLGVSELPPGAGPTGLVYITRAEWRPGPRPAGRLSVAWE